MNARSFAVLTTLFALSCSGPPPPAESLTPDAELGTAALPPGHPPVEGMPADPSGALSPGPTVSGTITLAEELGSSVLPSDVLYVMAKKEGATIAVRRVDEPSFPFAFEVSGSDAMTAETELSGPVEIVARVSKTGDAIAATGDLEGSTSNVAVPAQFVTLTIDHVRE